MDATSTPQLRRERWKLTARLVRALETPMLVLSGIWSLLLVMEFTRGLPPWLHTTNDVIWAAFVIQFGVEFPGFPDYGSALWWTAMLLTTMGSDYWPRTTEGRLLCLLLAVYAFAVFGYVTAAIAAYFVGKDKDVRLA